MDPVGPGSEMRAGSALILHVKSVWWWLDQLGGGGSLELKAPPSPWTIECTCAQGGPRGGALFWICSSLPGRWSEHLAPA